MNLFVPPKWVCKKHDYLVGANQQYVLMRVIDACLEKPEFLVKLGNDTKKLNYYLEKCSPLCCYIGEEKFQAFCLAGNGKMAFEMWVEFERQHGRIHDESAFPVFLAGYEVGLRGGRHVGHRERIRQVTLETVEEDQSGGDNDELRAGGDGAVGSDGSST